MNKFMTSAELKRNAKMQITRNPGTVIGAFLLYMAAMLPFMYVVTYLQMNSLPQTIVFTIANFVKSLISTIFMMGFSLIALEMTCGKQPQIMEIFYGFKGNVLKILKMYCCPAVITSVLYTMVLMSYNALLRFVENNEFMKNMYSITDPNEMMSYLIQADPNEMMDTYEQMVPFYMILFGILIVYLVVDIIINILYSQVLFVSLDYPDKTPLETVKLGFRIMKGSWGRYFYLLCSFILWDLLGAVTCGLSAIWVMPYKRLTYAGFYIDLMKNGSVGKN